MNIVTGCSGIDAIAYAALLLDIDVIGQIEIDDFCNKILELRYPGVKRYKDVFDVRGDEFGAVDIFAFGDPCQPHSVAGKRQGTADERFIWPELLRIIQTMRPAWILNENVTGSVSNGVVRDKILQLEGEGYRARAYTVPACAVGTPHERERVFIVAHARCPSRQGLLCPGGNAIKNRQGNASEIKRSGEVCESVGYSESERCARERISVQSRESRQVGVNADWTGEIMADTENTDRGRAGTAEHAGWGHSETGGRNISQTGLQHRPTQSRLGGNVNGLSGRLHEPGGYEDGSGIYEAFETIFTATLGQIPWPAGYGAEQYDYEPPRVATGVKNRTNRLKALGNSIVWQQIFGFLLGIKLIHERGFEREKN